MKLAIPFALVFALSACLADPLVDGDFEGDSLYASAGWVCADGRSNAEWNPSLALLWIGEQGETATTDVTPVELPAEFKLPPKMFSFVLREPAPLGFEKSFTLEGAPKLGEFRGAVGVPILFIDDGDGIYGPADELLGASRNYAFVHFDEDSQNTSQTSGVAGYRLARTHCGPAGLERIEFRDHEAFELWMRPDLEFADVIELPPTCIGPLAD